MAFKPARNVAIIGVGMTKHQSKRKDVNIQEMLWEAVQDAFDRGNMKIKVEDIQAFVFGNMHTFEGVNQPELIATDFIGALGKAVMRSTTGGTTGMTVAHNAYYWVASGMYDIVGALAFEKQSEGDSQTGLGAIVMPEIFTAGMLGAAFAGGGAGGGLSGGGGGGSTGGASYQAASYMKRTGATDEDLALACVLCRRNAAKNPYAHLRMPDLTVEDVLKSPIVAYPLRFAHTCPTSEGACLLVFASEKVAKKICEKPAWVLGVGSCSDSPTFNPLGGISSDPSDQPSCIEATKAAYQMAGIENPAKEIDVVENYDAWSHQTLMWMERLLLVPENEAPKALREGRFYMDGDIPVNPSGGVVSTNAIGCTAMIRPAEAALQVMELAGERQLKKKVRKAVAHGWGGLFQFNTVMVLGENPRRW